MLGNIAPEADANHRGAVARYGLALPLLLGGCAAFHLSDTNTVSSQDKAAAVLVTPTMVAPWYEVTDVLAPKFTMSGDAAVTKVLPTTERINEQLLSAFSASVAAGFPQTSTTSSSGTSQSAVQNTTTAAGIETATGSTGNSTTDTSTTTHAPGVVPTVPGGVPAAVAALAGGAVAGDLGVDPVMQYKAANYLNQYVQLLNREVQYSPGERCYIPFVVKLKLAVMPYRPRLGYALHTRIAFFKADEHNSFDAIKSPPTNKNACTSDAQVPYVIPVLAADDLQMAARSRSTELAQQLGLALSFMVSGVGASAGANKLDQKLRAVLNHDISSSLTVTREADNTLYVRIAPNNEASEQPALIGQTYDIAVLIMVPRGYFPHTVDPAAAQGELGPWLSMSSYTEFRNANDGTILPPRPPSDLVERMDRTMGLYLGGSALSAWQSLTAAEKQYAANTLAGPIQTGQYGLFLEAAKNALAGCPASTCIHVAPQVGYNAPILWTALSALLADSSFKTAIIALPHAPVLNLPRQPIFVIDDGNVATAVVRGVQDPTGHGIVANLSINVGASTTMAAGLKPFPQQSIAFDPNAHTLTLTFPSFAKLGVKPKSSGSTLILEAAPCDDSLTLCAAFAERVPISLEAVIIGGSKAPDAPAGFNITPALPYLYMSKDHSGSVALTVSKLKAGETAAVAIANAVVTTATDGAATALALTDDGYIIPKNGKYIFALRELAPDATVTMTATGSAAGQKTGVKTVTVTIRK